MIGYMITDRFNSKFYKHFTFHAYLEIVDEP